MPPRYRNIQEDDEEIELLKEAISNGLRTDLVLEDDVVYYIDTRTTGDGLKRIYAPKRSRYFLLNVAHDNQVYGGHLGVKATFRKLFNFWWPHMHSEVEKYVKSCDICQAHKNPVGMPPGYLYNIPVSSIFEHVHLDIMGPIEPRTTRGNLHIITATDGFSKWAFAQPVQNIRTETVIKFLESQIFSIYGFPKTVITDQGTQFTSNEWKEYFRANEIQHNMTSPYHPQANGVDERVNGTLTKILKPYVDDQHEDWDLNLKWAVYIYNTTVHNSTGFSPFQVLHGLEPRSPLKSSSASTDIDLISRMREVIRSKTNANIVRSQATQKRYYDRRHRQFCLKIGEIVKIREHTVPTGLSRKFYAKWLGPAVIIGIRGDPDEPRSVTVFDCTNLRSKTVALNDIAPYYTRDRDEYNQLERGDEGNSTNNLDKSMQSMASEADTSCHHDLVNNCRFDSEINMTQTSPLGSQRVPEGEEVDQYIVEGSTNNHCEINFSQEFEANQSSSPNLENICRPDTEEAILDPSNDHNTSPSRRVSINQEVQMHEFNSNLPVAPNEVHNPYLMDFIQDDSVKDPDFEAPRDKSTRRRSRIPRHSFFLRSKSTNNRS